MPDLTAAHPFEGVGAGLVAWTIFALIVSLGAAGFVAGFMANRAGVVHGFLTWAMSLLTIVVLLGSFTALIEYRTEMSIFALTPSLS